MKKRRVFIEGMTPPKPVVPQDRVTVQPWQATEPLEYNRKVNELRGNSSFVRHGTDAWPVKETLNNFVRIQPEPRPQGCAQVWYMTTAQETDNDLNRVWAVTACASGTRSLVTVFIRAPILEVGWLPISFAHIVSMNIRPLTKIRFGGHDYFIPEHNFVYLGYPYR